MKLRDEEAHSKATVEKRPSINQVVSNFCSYTTAHGLGRLAESRSVFRRVVWSLFCLGALTMFVIQMYNLFVIYLSRPVSTVVNVHHESHVSFPAVTICNLNMIRYEKLPKNFIENLLAEVYGEESEELTEEDQRSEPPTPIPTFDAPTESEANSGTVGVTNPSDNAASSSMNDGTAMATDGKAGGTIDSMGDISTVATLPTNEDIVTSSTEVPTGDTTTYPYNDDSSYDYHDNYDYNDDDGYDYNYDYDYDYYGFEGETKEKEFEIEETIRAELALKNDSTIIEMGHQFEDLVFECSFRGYDCRNYTKYWHQLWDYRHGNCYTFNGGITDDGENQRVLQSHITGPTGGLKLNLFIEQSQYIPELSHTAGARVVIHDQGQIPFPNNEGYSVLPSHSTSFAIRRSVIERADPFGNGSCVPDKDLKRNNLYSRKFNASYSRQACLNSCQAEKQIEACGCAEGQFPSEADICNLRNDATAKCLETIQRKLVTGGLDCEKQCPTPCREVQYRTTLSMGYWPSDGYEDILASRIKGNSALSKELEDGYLSENFLQVKVYYEQLNYEKVTERISYGGVNLVADIGGQLGLWIGISVLTCCEFLELAWMIIQAAFERLSRRNVIHVTP